MVRQRIKKRLYTKMTRTMNTFMRMDSTRVRMEEMATAMEHRLNSERELMKYPNELSQLTDRMASDSWQG